MTNNKVPFNVLIVILLSLCIYGLYYLSRLNLEAGPAYLLLLVISLIYVLVQIIANKSGTVNNWFEVPINKNNDRAILMLVFGCVCMFVLSGISMISGANLYSPFTMAPLAQFGSIGLGNNTFAALSAASSPFWTFFIIVISAAVIEELCLGFAFVAIGSLMSFGIRKLLGLNFGDSGGEHSGNALWDFVGSMFFSVVLFASLHYFNSTYVDPSTGKMIWSMFLWAAGFRFILNVFIYKFGNFGLEWSIGVHAINNAIFLGGATVGAALTTVPGGVVFDVLLVLFGYYAFTRIKEIIKEGNLIRKDFMDFD